MVALLLTMGSKGSGPVGRARSVGTRGEVVGRLEVPGHVYPTLGVKDYKKNGL